MQVFTHSGSFLRSFGQYGSGPGELNRPVGILVHNEHVYITEVASLCISVFTTSGEFSTSFAVGHRVRGITTDRDGYLYVCVQGSDCIYIY